MPMAATSQITSRMPSGGAKRGGQFPRTFSLRKTTTWLGKSKRMWPEPYHTNQLIMQSPAYHARDIMRGGAAKDGETKQPVPAIEINEDK